MRWNVFAVVGSASNRWNQSCQASFSRQDHFAPGIPTFMTATTQKPRIPSSPRRTVSDVKHVEVLENGSAALDLALEDGAGLKLACPPALVMKLVSRLASHALIHAAGGLEEQHQPEIKVAYEAGKGRVRLTVAESGSRAGFQLILSNSAAEDLARDLITAAQMSVGPRPPAPVKP